MEVKVSKHGDKRIRQRMGLKRKAVLRQFSLALDRGVAMKDTNGGLHKWMVSIALHEQIPHSVTCYNGYAFLWSLYKDLEAGTQEATLITVLPIPGNLQHSYANAVKNKESK